MIEHTPRQGEATYSWEGRKVTVIFVIYDWRRKICPEAMKHSHITDYYTYRGRGSSLIIRLRLITTDKEYWVASTYVINWT